MTTLLKAVCIIALAYLATAARADLVVPAGLAPGDTYHVMFITSTTTSALSSNIADYDAFVQVVADAAGIGVSMGISWLALGSTDSVDAIAHLAPLFSSSTDVPVYNQNGELLSPNFNGLWDGLLDALVRYDENGWGGYPGYVWTGTRSDGTGVPGQVLGTQPPGTVSAGNAASLQGQIESFDQFVPDMSLPLYAISQELTVTAIPIPPALWLFGSGLLGLIGVAMKKTTNKRI